MESDISVWKYKFAFSMIAYGKKLYLGIIDTSVIAVEVLATIKNNKTTSYTNLQNTNSFTLNQISCVKDPEDLRAE